MEGVFISHKEGFSWNLLDRMSAAVWVMMRRDGDLVSHSKLNSVGSQPDLLQIHLLVCGRHWLSPMPMDGGGCLLFETLLAAVVAYLR